MEKVYIYCPLIIAEGSSEPPVENLNPDFDGTRSSSGSEDEFHVEGESEEDFDSTGNLYVYCACVSEGNIS